MGSRGIDHRNSESVLNAFDIANMTNWAIFAGKDPVIIYDAGDPAEAKERLSEYLDIIEASPTRTIYTLRLYYPDQSRITNKTPFSCSTTFMLSEDFPATKDPESGAIIVRGTGQTPSVNNSSLVSRIERLEEQNVKLLRELHETEMKHLQEKIAAIGTTAATPEPMQILVEKIAARPEIITDTIAKILDKIFPPTPAPAPFVMPPIAGTMQQQPAPTPPPPPPTKEADMTPQQQEQQEQEQETDQEQSTEDLTDLQNDAMDHICERVGDQATTDLFVMVANLPDADLIAWYNCQVQLSTLAAKIGWEQTLSLVRGAATTSDKNLKMLLSML